MKRNKLTIAIIFILVAMLAIGTSVALATSEQQLTPNPNITIVNPVSGSVVYSSNLLVSVKMTAPLSINILVEREFVITEEGNESLSLPEHMQADRIYSTTISGPSAFTNANNLSFHTELVSNIEPGIYRVTVETVNSEGNVIYVNTSLVEVRDAAENPINITATDGQNSGTAQFLRNILRAIFGD